MPMLATGRKGLDGGVAWMARKEQQRCTSMVAAATTLDGGCGTATGDGGALVVAGSGGG
jgi:hypothetical protein